MGLFDMLKRKPVQETNQNPAAVVICQSDSPVCSMQAFVEKTDTTYYFYTFQYVKNEIRTCWICNRVTAPKTLDPDSMKNGTAPLLPAEHVGHNINGMDLDDKKLSIVWFEEGCSAALFCDSELIAVIPEWSGIKDFHGYSKYAVGKGQYAWELNEEAEINLVSEIRSGIALWSCFGTMNAAKSYMMTQLAEVRDFVGIHECDYDISHNKYPPKAVVSGSRGGVVYCISIGASLIPMPTVRMHLENPDDFRHTEFGFAAVEKHRSICRPMSGNLGFYSDYPWLEQTFFAHGHTIPFNNIKDFSAILFINPDMTYGIEKPPYHAFADGSRTNILWLVPITQQEYDFTVQNGVDALIKRASDPSRIHIFDAKPKFIM